MKSELIGRPEATVPEPHSAIEFQDAATPLAFKRDTNSTDGATSACMCA